jgi:hypothetical protein
MNTILQAVVCALSLGGLAASAAAELVDAPVVWYADDRRPIPMPAERDPNLTWDYVNETVVRWASRTTDPGRVVRRIGTAFGRDHVQAAPNVNALDEVPNSSWFTNRIGLYPMSLEEIQRGSGAGVGPDRSGPWTIVGAKTQGVTPGFTIRDVRGDMYLIKFDPPQHEGMVTGAGVISQRILHAAGFFVPDDNITWFSREDLILGDGVTMKPKEGSKRPMVEQDIDDILASVASHDGTWRAISSKFVDGRPIGPFDYQGTRHDDLNDRVDHAQRRELRGMAVFAAWLNHFDTKQHNSLDAYVSTEDGGYVRHYLIDFASTLGTGADGPARRFGWEATADGKAVIRRTLNLGLVEDDWRKVERPEGLDEIGFFEVEQFDPLGFEPLYANPAFAEVTSRDGYWAAKIISAFTDGHLRVICEQARYRDPRATEYMARTLAGRRDKIARAWFDKMPPLDFFVVDGDRLTYHDLGAERGVYTGDPRYRTRVRPVDAHGKPLEEAPWVEAAVTEVDLDRAGEGPFVAVECQVDRGHGWSDSIVAYLATASGRVVAVDR